jgi:hypothetical protein
MPLETYMEAADLYLARGGDINDRRPLFTGDLFAEVPVPGVPGAGMAIIVAHPCSMRGSEARLRETVLVAAVEPHQPVGRDAWTRGYSDMMPLPEATGSDLYVGRFSRLGMANSEDLSAGRRVACLSVYGVNLLQQRLIWHLTRLEVPTFRLQEAFAHTYEEADILEDWSDILCDAGWVVADAAARFEQFVRSAGRSGRPLQEDLRDAQLRSAVRTACRTEARRLTEEPALGTNPP